MKKVLVFLLTAILAIASLSLVASAANDSPETSGAVIDVTGTDKNNANLGIKIVEASDSTKTNLQTEIDKYLKADNKDYSMLDAKNLSLEKVGDTTGNYDELLKKVEFPFNLKFTVTGVTENDTGFFLLLKEDGTFVKIPATFGNGTMSGSFDALGDVAFVVNKTVTKPVDSTVKDETGKSPKTSDSVTPVVCMVLFAAVVVMGYSVKKIKTEI